MSKTIALVDDDRNILTSVSMALENEGFKVHTYLDGESAYIGMTRNPPDLAVIDLKMPKMNGEELLERLRKKSTIPVILLTSKDDEVDELLGLKLGADDYVKKSGGFSIKVLIERIRVQLRKLESKNSIQPKNILTVGKLTLDSEQLECLWGDKPLPEKLTTTEFKIIYELAKRPGVLKERAYLMNIAYKNEDSDIEDRTIDSHIKRIRKKNIQTHQTPELQFKRRIHPNGLTSRKDTGMNSSLRQKYRSIYHNKKYFGPLPVKTIGEYITLKNDILDIYTEYSFST